MTDRTTIVVADDHVGSLHIPPQALDTASNDVMWVNAPLDGMLGSRRMSVPLAARSVRFGGRLLLEFRWRPLIGWLLFAVYTVLADGYMEDDLGYWPQAVVSGCIGLWLASASNRPRQLPYRSHVGEVVIPQVHAETARRWTEVNPSVRTTDAPVARRQPRSFYAAWSAMLLLASAGAFIYLADDGREQSLAIWAVVAVVFVSGVRTAVKMAPLGREG